jgi:glycosyltransferase involved in cell wall biosynthesis
MKIAHITNYVVPGYGYEELQLAKAQTKLGHDVAIITSNFLHPKGRAYGVLGARFPKRKISPGEENHDGVRVIRLASVELPGTRVWIRGLFAQLDRLAPDVVHCHNLLQIQTVRLAMAKAVGGERVRLVVDDHMHQSVVRKSATGRAFYAFHRAVIQPLLSREVDRFCAISQDTRTYLREQCGVRAEIELRPLGVDTDAFKPSPELRRRWRQRLRIETGELVITYVGKIIEAKGARVLADAALRLLAQGDRFKVVMVGDADAAYLVSIMRWVEDAGHVDAFRFHASVVHGDLPGVYAAADIAVWPRQESMAIFEAMATALPVVVSSRSGYRSLVEEIVGLTFDHDDVDSLADVLKTLFEADLRRRFGAAGRELVVRDYSWRRSAERYLETYTDAARRPVATPAR